MARSLPAGDSEVIGDTHTHTGETVKCAKKGVREEEVNFPGGILESISVSIS